MFLIDVDTGPRPDMAQKNAALLAANWNSRNLNIDAGRVGCREMPYRDKCT